MEDITEDIMEKFMEAIESNEDLLACYLSGAEIGTRMKDDNTVEIYTKNPVAVRRDFGDGKVHVFEKAPLKFGGCSDPSCCA
tara:strand:- start:29548 stop:29793 length:246 start_codon:yes stop_codon:yes gene_type:complete